MAGGRPTDYNPDIHPAIAESLARKGLTNTEIADGIGIATSTFHNWRDAHPEFMDAVKRGKDSADDNVEKSLYNRAIGYETTEEKALNIGGELVKTNVKVNIHPDPTSIIFWLKNRRPREWRDRKEISGPEGGPIRLVTAKDLTDDELAAIAARGANE